MEPLQFHRVDWEALSQWARELRDTYHEAQVIVSDSRPRGFILFESDFNMICSLEQHFNKISLTSHKPLSAL